MLERIVKAEPSMREDIETLHAFPLDVPEPLVLLTLAIARDVLARHEQGHITDDDLEAWADALEMRHDVRPCRYITTSSLSTCSTFQHQS